MKNPLRLRLGAAWVALPVFQLAVAAPLVPRVEYRGESALRLELAWAVMADDDGRWDHFQGREIAVSAETAVFSRDESLVATTAKGDDSVRLFEAASGRQAWRMPGDAETECAAFTRDQRHLVTGGEADPELRIWRVADGALVRSYREIRSVEGMRFNPSGDRLATGSEGGQIRIYDTSAADPADWPDRPLFVLTHGPDRDASGVASDGESDVNQLDWSRDGRWLYSAGRNGLVKKWRVADFARPDGGLATTYRGHTGSVKCVRVSPDGSLVAAGSGWTPGSAPHGARVIVWREADGAVLIDHPVRELRVVETVAFDPGQRVLLAGGSEIGWKREKGTTLVWRLPDVLDGRSEPVQRIVWYDVEYLEFSRQGERLLPAHADGSLRVWRPEFAGAAAAPAVR